VAIISLKNKTEFKNYQCEATSMIFFNNKDTVILNKDEYIIELSARGFDLVILDKSKLEKLIKLDTPQLRFNFHDKMNIAKGIDIFSSFLPNQADYFFGLNKNKKIAIFKGNILRFTKIIHPQV